MNKSILLLFILSFSVRAENFRAPAVLDNSCNLNIPTQLVSIVNGKEVITEKEASQVQKEQCKEIRKCMASAEDEEMQELKSLEGVACNAKLTAVNTRTPAIVPDKNFDGNRTAKEVIADDFPQIKTPSGTAKAK
jgi:hypothetical protein